MGALEVPAPVQLGRYEVIARLASGGMGEIFLARLEGAAGFEKLFVVKRILPHLAGDARFRAMLIAEARIASRMAHANICQVYELGETGGQLFIVMEHLEGIGLLPLLRKSSREGIELELGFVAGVVQQCCEALHYAHELRDPDGEPVGIVHRDVTPANIFITEAGVAKLLDFGIAKAKDASANTQTGAVKGKHAYMAPEQLRGGEIDRRVDVFALGVVTYEMLALRRLFQRKTDYLTFRAVMEQPIPDVRGYRPDAPAALAELLARALDRDPAGRPATARQLGASVLDALPGIRPWSQSDISDFLRARFADEIARRRAEAARAVRGSGPLNDAGVPTLGFDELDDEEDDFPTVETGLEDGSIDDRPLPPLGGWPAASPEVPAPRPVAPRRSVLWPLLAIAMVGITATALFLVWRERQPPETIIVTESRSEPPPAAGPPPSAAAERGEPGPAPAAADPAGGRDRAGSARPRAGAPRPADPYTAVINAHRPQLNRCMNDNPLPTGAPKVNVKVKVIVAPSGKPREVAFEPGPLDGTAAGACIKSTLSAATFPSAKAELTVAFPIWL